MLQNAEAVLEYNCTSATMTIQFCPSPFSRTHLGFRGIRLTKLHVANPLKEAEGGLHQDSLLKELEGMQSLGWMVAYTDSPPKRVRGWMQVDVSPPLPNGRVPIVPGPSLLPPLVMAFHRSQCPTSLDAIFH